MGTILRGSLLVALACCSACDSKKASEPTSAAPLKGAPNQDLVPVDPTKIPIGEGSCKLDTSQAGPLRRVGRASIELTGDGAPIRAKDVKALCGPMFNTDVPALGIVAGQGLLFEVCLPEGNLQLSAEQRTPGTHSLRPSAESGGVELIFNRNAGSSYSTRATDADKVTFSADLWKAEAQVVLTDVAERGSLRAKVSFDCSDAPATGGSTGAAGSSG